MKRAMYKGCLIGGIFLVSISLMSPAIVAGQSYPSKTIVWIVASAPGGGYDTYARVFSLRLRKYLPGNVNVVVKNVPGAGGLNGATKIFNAKPDGYTIGYIYYPGIAILQMMSDIGFDPAEFVPIAQIAVDTQGVFVSAKSNINSMADLQKRDPVRVLTQPKGVTMYSFWVITTKMFKLNSKLVTGYKGGSEVATGLMRGDGDAGILNLTNFFKYVESGDLRVILTFSKERNALTPDVPTVAELGQPEGTVCAGWKVVFGPPGLPADRAKILQDAFRKAAAEPELLAWAKKANREINYLDGATAWKELQDVLRIYKKYH